MIKWSLMMVLKRLSFPSYSLDYDEIFNKAFERIKNHKFAEPNVKGVRFTMFNFNWSKWSHILSIDGKTVQVRYHLKTYEVQFKIINSLSISLHLSQENAKIVNEVIEEMKQTPKFLLEKL
jgi:hypothetical protein